ncbi:MAG: LysR family transcriptional regulator, partial [Verrucomicrobiota bacterium]
MHIETLRLFSELVETQSFSVVAERSGVTQSAVSQKI